MDTFFAPIIAKGKFLAESWTGAHSEEHTVTQSSTTHEVLVASSSTTEGTTLEGHGQGSAKVVVAGVSHGAPIISGLTAQAPVDERVEQASTTVSFFKLSNPTVKLAESWSGQHLDAMVPADPNELLFQREILVATSADTELTPSNKNVIVNGVFNNQLLVSAITPDIPSGSSDPEVIDQSGFVMLSKPVEVKQAEAWSGEHLEMTSHGERKVQMVTQEFQMVQENAQQAAGALPIVAGVFNGQPLIQGIVPQTPAPSPAGSGIADAFLQASSTQHTVAESWTGGHTTTTEQKPVEAPKLQLTAQIQQPVQVKKLEAEISTSTEPTVPEPISVSDNASKLPFNLPEGLVTPGTEKKISDMFSQAQSFMSGENKSGSTEIEMSFEKKSSRTITEQIIEGVGNVPQVIEGVFKGQPVSGGVIPQTPEQPKTVSETGSSTKTVESSAHGGAEVQMTVEKTSSRTVTEQIIEGVQNIPQVIEGVFKGQAVSGGVSSTKADHEALSETSVPKRAAEPASGGAEIQMSMEKSSTKTVKEQIIEGVGNIPQVIEGIFKEQQVSGGASPGISETKATAQTTASSASTEQMSGGTEVHMTMEQSSSRTVTEQVIEGVGKMPESIEGLFKGQTASGGVSSIPPIVPKATTPTKTPPPMTKKDASPKARTPPASAKKEASPQPKGKTPPNTPTKASPKGSPAPMTPATNIEVKSKAPPAGASIVSTPGPEAAKPTTTPDPLSMLQDQLKSFGMSDNPMVKNMQQTLAGGVNTGMQMQFEAEHSRSSKTTSTSIETSGGSELNMQDFAHQQLQDHMHNLLNSSAGTKTQGFTEIHQTGEPTGTISEQAESGQESFVDEHGNNVTVSKASRRVVSTSKSVQQGTTQAKRTTEVKSVAQAQTVSQQSTQGRTGSQGKPTIIRLKVNSKVFKGELDSDQHIHLTPLQQPGGEKK